MRAHPHFRYEEVARFITGLVDAGTLSPGSRAPSLREISGQRRSASRPRCRPIACWKIVAFWRRGRNRASISPSAPPFARRRRRFPTAGKATHVAISAMLVRLLQYAADPRLVPLGCAIPSAELLAAGRLDRFLARAARTKGTEYNTYTHPKGDLRLRQEIARRALRWGQALSPDDIVITCGCTEAVTLALKAVAKPGDTIAIEIADLFWRAARARSARPQGARTADRCDRWNRRRGPGKGAQTQASRRACCRRASTIRWAAPCPTRRRLEVLALLARHRVPLIEDDIYGDIYFGAERPKPFMALDRHGNTIYCSSFSKTIAPGYRVGWIATGRQMQQSALEHKLAFTLSGPSLPQVAFADFLSSGGYDNHLRRIRRVFADNVDQMSGPSIDRFRNRSKVSRPAGSFVLWLELPKHLGRRELLTRR